ncbi:MAG: cytochrome C554 [Lentisphaerae bacterium]|nr:cytochrome C554 [Lentisphaerota bacterium]
MHYKTLLPLAVLVGSTIVLLRVVASIAGEPDAANYVGPRMCGACHKKDDTGNQFKLWQESQHAKAFERLATPEAKEAGKKVGVDNPQTSGKCLKCHATAYNFTESAATQKIKPEDGVTCESCHGPGKNYLKKDVMENREQAVAGGLIYPASKNCERCHNSEAPSWKPDRFTTKDGKKVGFDYEQAYEKIKHPNPKLKP